jgi:hypothetical protein
VFAPISWIESMCLLLALATQEGWTIHHIDVNSAFLNGELVEEVYIRQPPSFIINGQEDKVLHLDKALYGLHQAPRAWNAKLNETLVALTPAIVHQSIQCTLVVRACPSCWRVSTSMASSSPGTTALRLTTSSGK